jgi:hypothetical protein
MENFSRHGLANWAPADSAMSARPPIQRGILWAPFTNLSNHDTLRDCDRRELISGVHIPVHRLDKGSLFDKFDPVESFHSHQELIMRATDNLGLAS